VTASNPQTSGKNHAEEVAPISLLSDCTEQFRPAVGLHVK